MVAVSTCNAEAQAAVFGWKGRRTGVGCSRLKPLDCDLKCSIHRLVEGEPLATSEAEGEAVEILDLEKVRLGSLDCVGGGQFSIRRGSGANLTDLLGA